MMQGWQGALPQVVIPEANHGPPRGNGSKKNTKPKHKYIVTMNGKNQKS